MKLARNLLLTLMACGLLVSANPTPLFAQAFVTDVIDAGDEDDPFDAIIRVWYELSIVNGRISREAPCVAGSADACLSGSEVVPKKELEYDRTLHQLIINPRIGIYKDLELSVDIPIVLLDQTKLTLADPSNTSVVSDFTNPSSPSNLIQIGADNPFVGPARAGLGDISFALRYAPLNFQRDETSPTWVLALRYTAPLGEVKTASNTAVGEGLHALDLSSTISRRALPWLEPYFSFHGTFRFGGTDTLFVDSDTQTLSRPGNILGIELGTQIIPWEDKLADARFEMDFGIAADFVFEGREYTPLFDALGNSPCNDDPACLLTTYKRDPSLSTNGITDVEQYGLFRGWAGLHYQPIKYIQLGAKFSYLRQTPHFITNADPGKDLNGDGVVTADAAFAEGPNKNEYSPIYVEGIDAPAGHQDLNGQPTRFRIQGSDHFQVLFHLTGKF